MKKRNSITDVINNKVASKLKNVSYPILIGFSGGSDSSTLLYSILSYVKPENIICVHVNHMIRGEEADLDAKHCENICSSLHVKCIVVKKDVPSLAKSKSIEEAARDVRYEVFENICREYGCKTIALAHNKSDNLETVIFNLARGSALSGIKGIPDERNLGEFKIIRPLIDISKDEINEYCKENSIDYVIDKTNDDVNYTRNYIRHEIAPKLKKINPKVEDSVFRMSRIIATDNEYLDNIAIDFINKNAHNGQLDLSSFNELHKSIASRVIIKYSNISSLTEYHIESIINACLLDEESCICLPDKHYAYISNHKLNITNELIKKENIRCFFNYELKEGYFPEGFYISYEKCDIPGYHLVGFANISNSDEQKINIRSYKAGDKYYFYKMTRSIKKTANNLDNKIKRIRPVFTIDDIVFWYPGYPVSNKYITNDDCFTVYYYEQD